MAISVFQLGAADVERARAQLGHIKGGPERAIAAALNRAADMAMAEAVRKVRDIYTIKARDVRQTMHISRARPGDTTPTAIISSKDGALPLDRFKMRPTRPPKKRREVQIEVRKGRTRGMGRRNFVAQMPSGKIGVFARTGEWRTMRAGRYAGQVREAIKLLYGPAIPVMLGVPDVADAVTARAGSVVLDRLEHEIGRLFDKGRKR
jgi:hypothetical protein